MVRFQVEITEERMKELEAFMEENGIRTRIELFDTATALLKWAVRQTELGRVVVSVDESQPQKIWQLVMPGVTKA